MSNIDRLPLEQYWRVIRRWWWLVVASVLVASVSSYLSVSRATRIYQATSTVIVGQSLEKANPTYQDFSISQQLAQTYINMVGRAPILQGAARALGMDYAPSPGSVTARIVPGTQLIEISVRHSSPERARDLADEIARQLIQQTPGASEMDRERRLFVQRQLQDLEQNIEQTQDEIADEQARLDAANSARAIQQYQSNIAALQNKLSSYQSSYASLLSTVQGGTNYITLVEPARTPTTPVSPQVMETVALAAAIGMGLALGGAFLVEFLDDTLKTVDDAVRAAELPALGAIPRIPGPEEADRLLALHRPRSAIAEAFRAARTNVQFSSLDSPLRTLMVTSAEPGEGKSLTLANLAVVMAQEGRSVVIVDADLRRPKQHKLFELDNSRGLCDAILDDHADPDAYSTRVSPEQLRAPFMAADGTAPQRAAVAEVGELRVLTSGPTPPNPADLLGSRRMAALLKRLTLRADVVLVDCPPVLAAADANVLANRVDGVLLLADIGNTRRTRLLRAVEQLRQVDAPLLGLVANHVTSRHDRYYYYDYYITEDGRTVRTRRRGQSAAPLSLPTFLSGLSLLGRRNGQEQEAPQPAGEPAPGRTPSPGLEATQPVRIPPGAGLAESLDPKKTQSIRIPPDMLREAEAARDAQQPGPDRPPESDE